MYVKKPDKGQTSQSAPYPAVVSTNNSPSERTFEIIAWGVSKCQWIFVQQKISKEVVRTPQLELFKFVLGIVRDRYNIVLELFQVTSHFLLFRHLYLFLFIVR